MYYSSGEQDLLFTLSWWGVSCTDMSPILLLGSRSGVQFPQGCMCRCDEERLGAEPEEPRTPGGHSEADGQPPEVVAAAPRWGGWSQKPPAGSSSHQTGKQGSAVVCDMGDTDVVQFCLIPPHSGQQWQEAFRCQSSKRWQKKKKSQPSCKPARQEIWAAGSCSKLKLLMEIAHIIVLMQSLFWGWDLGSCVTFF